MSDDIDDSRYGFEWNISSFPLVAGLLSPSTGTSTSAGHEGLSLSSFVVDMESVEPTTPSTAPLHSNIFNMSAD